MFKWKYIRVLLVLWIINQQDNYIMAQALEYSRGLPFIKTYTASDYEGEAQNWAFIQNELSKK